MKNLLNEKFGMILKLFVYQFAMSLLGLFVASPFENSSLILAGVFSTLFYFSLVSYAIIEDGQKDGVSAKAGRIQGNKFTGLKYALVSYMPTMIIVLVNCVLRLLTSNTSLLALKNILNIVIRFFLMGMYLGLDAGLTQYNYDPVMQIQVSNAPEWIRFLSDNGITFLIFTIFMPIVVWIIYALAFDGKLHVNTAPKEKKKKH